MSDSHREPVGPAAAVDSSEPTLADFHYELPNELIARYPLEHRSESRLLCLDKEGPLEHRHFHELPQRLRAGDLLVLNDTRVLPARMYGRKSSGGAVELLFERERQGNRFTAMARSSKPLRPGMRIQLLARDGALSGMEISVEGREGAVAEFALPEGVTCQDLLLRCGHVPIPPYLEREEADVDHERYQTVFARHDGSVAAPTAGLHFDAPLLEQIRALGVEVAYTTLHVGAGTFSPVRVSDLAQHTMHSERFTVAAPLVAAVAATKQRGRRVVAVGTTVVRALESAVDASGTLQATSGETTIFIYPGYQFRVVDALVTNFHLPESTLLMLVSAFAGRERVLAAYREAVRKHYRFFSYGDAMWLTRRDTKDRT